MSDLKFYDLNPTWSTIKKKFVTQHNPPSPKNRPNPAGWVGSGWQVGCTPLIIIPHLLKLYNVKIYSWGQPKKATRHGTSTHHIFCQEKLVNPYSQSLIIIFHTESMTFIESPNHFVFFPLKRSIQKNGSASKSPNILLSFFVTKEWVNFIV